MGGVWQRKDRKRKPHTLNNYVRRIFSLENSRNRKNKVGEAPIGLIGWFL